MQSFENMILLIPKQQTATEIISDFPETEANIHLPVLSLC